MRTTIVVLLLLVFSGSYGQTKYRKDFDHYWKTVKEYFAYFDTQKSDWNKARAIYQPLADTVTTNRSFIRLLEDLNHELYNGHVGLNVNLSSSNRMIPTGADLWVAYRQQGFIVTAVREGFGADRSGLKKGMRITRFDALPMDSAIRPFLPRSVALHDERMYEYAANMLLAGRHNSKRSITAVWKGQEHIFYPDSATGAFGAQDPKLLEYRKIPSNIGYVRINNSLGDHGLIKVFDEALDRLWKTKGLIIDLRETPSGGNTTVARAIMSRFIEKELPYQKHRLSNEEQQYGVRRSWVELVSPRGKTYKKPLVILVGRWTGSMGEGMAIGFDGMKRAEIVGDKMAGLLGAIYSFTLPETGIGFSIPAEKLFHVNGTPREAFTPRYTVGPNEGYLSVATRLLSK